jgi:hypothetical protein
MKMAKVVSPAVARQSGERRNVTAGQNATEVDAVAHIWMPRERAVMTHYLPSEAELDRLIQSAAPKRGRRRPLQVVRPDLAFDLSVAESQWRIGSELFSKRITATKARLFKRLAAATAGLRSLLLDENSELKEKSGSYAFRALSLYRSPEGPQFLGWLDRISTEAQSMERITGGGISLGLSLRAWFAAEILAPIYGRHFGQVSHNPKGPCVRFVVEAATYMGITIAPATVEKGIKRARNLKKRLREGYIWLIWGNRDLQCEYTCRVLAVSVSAAHFGSGIGPPASFFANAPSSPTSGGAPKSAFL